MSELTDKFPTAYYQAHDHLVCPNGDKLRSDAEGLFCWIEGERVPAEIINGIVVPRSILVEDKPAAKGKVKDANG